MIVTYILAVCLTALLLYLLKHAKVKNLRYGLPPEWIPFKLKRWKVFVLVLVILIPICHIVIPLILMGILFTDIDIKIDIDNFLTRTGKRIKDWMNQEI